MFRGFINKKGGRHIRKVGNGAQINGDGHFDLKRFIRSNAFKFILAVFLTTGLTFLFPVESFFLPLHAPKSGSVATEDIIAPYDFYIGKSPAELEQERRKVLDNLPVYLVYDKEVTEMVRVSFRRFFDDLNKLGRQNSKAEALKNLAVKYSGLSLEQVKILGDPKAVSEFMAVLIDLADSLLNVGIIDDINSVPLAGNRLAVIVRDGQNITIPRNQVGDIALSLQLADSRINDALKDMQMREAAMASFQYLIRPNLVFSLKLTEQAKQSALGGISPFKGMVLKDELIIQKHERVTPAHLEKLNSLAALKGGNQPDGSRMAKWLPILSRFFFIGFLVAFTAAFIRYFKQEIFNSLRKLILIAVVFVLEALLTYFIDFQWHLSAYLIPVTMAAMLLTVLFEVEVGLLLAIVISLLIGIVRNFDFSISFISIIAGTVAAYSVRRVRHRHDFYRPIFYTAIAYMIAIYCVEALKFKSVVEIIKECAFGAFNGFISPLLVIALLPLFETIFKITTDITLLELSDLNHPLLKRLSLEAPGTYHHSIIIGTLAEEAAKSIEANSLLARVGSYYHDIGKSLKAEYFVENQMGAQNKHEKLSPSMSALILESHVKEGREMAKLAGLPQIIIDFIEQHHGDSIMSYFHQKALDQGASESEAAALRYPGPKPNFRESAIVSIADSVEAASRTLDDPKPTRLRNLVRKIIDDKCSSGQLNDSNLTFSDIHKIEDSFAFVLTAIFHNRIKYPEKEEHI